GVLAGRLRRLREHAAGTGWRARQDEAYIVVDLDQPVGIDDTERILAALEGTHLEQDRLVGPDAQALQVPELLAARHLAIAFGQGIDRGRNEEAKRRQRRGKFRGGKDRAIVLVDERPEGVPDLRLRGGEIPVIPP